MPQLNNEVMGRSFRTKQDYDQALKDAERINRLKQNTDFDNIEEIRELLDDLHSNRIRFFTLLGDDFIEEVEEREVYLLQNPPQPKKKGLFGKASKDTRKSKENSGSKTSKANETGYLSREASEIINKACAEIEEKYNDPDFRLSNLHEKYGISAVYLCKLFKKAKEMSPSDYLARIRLEKSKALLGLGYGVSKTAYAVGFLDPLYFSRFFKKHTGYSPSEYFDIFSE